MGAVRFSDVGIPVYDNVFMIGNPKKTDRFIIGNVSEVDYRNAKKVDAVKAFQVKLNDQIYHHHMYYGGRYDIEYDGHHLIAFIDLRYGTFAESNSVKQMNDMVKEFGHHIVNVGGNIERVHSNHPFMRLRHKNHFASPDGVSYSGMNRIKSFNSEFDNQKIAISVLGDIPSFVYSPEFTEWLFWQLSENYNFGFSMEAEYEDDDIPALPDIEIYEFEEAGVKLKAYIPEVMHFVNIVELEPISVTVNMRIGHITRERMNEVFGQYGFIDGLVNVGVFSFINDEASAVSQARAFWRGFLKSKGTRLEIDNSFPLILEEFEGIPVYVWKAE